VSPYSLEDEQAARAVVDHHTLLTATLRERSQRLIAAVEHDDVPEIWVRRDELLNWLRGDLLPHAAAEEATLYRAAAAQIRGELLVAGMIDEHRVITSLVVELESATSPTAAAAAARALVAVLATHLKKENDLVVPLVLRAENTSLAAVLGGMHELVGGYPGNGRNGASSGGQRR
jgi:iron-sulfur cluster repair protein YtfE (RIC family)